MSLHTRLVRVWALLGVALLFGNAALRLGRRGVAVVGAGLSTAEWIVLVAVTAVFVYGEGFRALQRKYVPFVVERVRTLKAASPLPHRILAPLYAMSLLGAERRGVVRAWFGVAAVVAAVLLVRWLPEPWRGIIDVGVAGALSWGLVALLIRGLPATGGRMELR